MPHSVLQQQAEILLSCGSPKGHYVLQFADHFVSWFCFFFFGRHLTSGCEVVGCVLVHYYALRALLCLASALH
jgi:hypothetical protein